MPNHICLDTSAIYKFGRAQMKLSRITLKSDSTFLFCKTKVLILSRNFLWILIGKPELLAAYCNTMRKVSIRQFVSIFIWI